MCVWKIITSLTISFSHTECCYRLSVYVFLRSPSSFRQRHVEGPLLSRLRDRRPHIVHVEDSRNDGRRSQSRITSSPSRRHIESTCVCVCVCVCDRVLGKGRVIPVQVPPRYTSYIVTSGCTRRRETTRVRRPYRLGGSCGVTQPHL